MDSRLELETKITALIVGKDMVRVKNFLSRHFKSNEFNSLTTFELEKALPLIEDAIYKGEIR
jgi:hypothetical protein